MQSGQLYQLPMWEPATAAPAPGSLPTSPDNKPYLPTPAACIAQDREHPSTWLARRERVKLTVNNGNGMGMPLTIAAKLLMPTQSTNNSKNSSPPSSQAEQDELAGHMLRNNSIPTGAATYLNPSFVEEMMGFPVGWTACEPLAMP